ncbi:MAG: hypothetical protein QF441_05140 [Bacteriovoracaceae bacterium]|nr:hypothetical protein [Halobacteriovoraceae bacterium]MDP7319969.1 hypothetical protein [Bacteriovoracaceae bacterium]
MKFFLSTLVLITLFSCASKKYDYQTYNDSFKAGESSQNSVTLIKLSDIPKFSSSRDLMAPGFLFSLYHVSDEKLRGRYRVNHRGILRLPYGVKIDAKNKTFSSLKKEVQNAYKRFFQKGVNNVVFRLLRMDYYVEIRGFVKKPGRYLVTRKESLDKIIDLAGGLKGDLTKNLFTVALKQKNESYSISLNQYYQSDIFSEAFTWTGEDTIFVKNQSEVSNPKSIPIVTVMSGVREPGKSLYREEENLFYYLNKSGGTQDYLGYDQSYIIRETPQGLKNIRFDITQMETIPKIMPNDIIMLNGNKETQFDKTLNRTAQISSILSTIALLILAL